MIKVSSPYFFPVTLRISSAETPISLQSRLQKETGENFTFDLMDAFTGRVLGFDELILDNREYYAIFNNLPVELIPTYEKVKSH